MQEFLAYMILAGLIVFVALPAIGRDSKWPAYMSYWEAFFAGLAIVGKVLFVAFLVFLAFWSIQTLGA